MEGEKIVYAVLNTVVVLYVIYFVLELLVNNDILNIPIEANLAVIFFSWILIGFVLGVAVGVRISRSYDDQEEISIV